MAYRTRIFSIRTSGEQRLVQIILLWQLAYTEFYFTDCALAGFHNKRNLVKAIEQYNSKRPAVTAA